MTSRHTLRVKVMQTLYTLAAAGPDTASTKTAALLDDRLDATADAAAVGLLYVARIAQYAEVDAVQRASRRLATTEDRAVNTKLAGNTLLWTLLEEETFKRRVTDRHLERYVDDDLVKASYRALADAPWYAAYTATEGRDPKEERSILQRIWQAHVLEDAAVDEALSEELPAWAEDRASVKQIVETWLAKPHKVNFLQLLSPEKRRYAQDLMGTVTEREAQLMELIAPKYQNWEADRVAVIDTILLKMGVAEFLYFPTIPTKVTINEYIDIAKHYSTPQSGQFVNGVLDNLLKELQAAGRIRKADRQPNA